MSLTNKVLYDIDQSDYPSYQKAIARKNIGAYEDKTTDGGIPKADLAQEVQSSLSKADSALQGVKVNGTELSKDSNNKVDVPVPTASSTTPAMDGSASAGSESRWARGDHVHPTDTTREALANKKHSVDPTSTTDYVSAKGVADFVNSSVATNTANFLGSFKLTDLGLTYPATNVQIAAALNSYTWPTGVSPTNNDYVYVEIQDPQTTSVDDRVERFKFSDTLASWGYEYTLNNSSFTAEEIAAIDSGITATDKAEYDAHVDDVNIHVTAANKTAWNGKQDTISDLSTIRSGASAGATALQPGGDGSNLTVIPDGTSTGTDIGNSTTLKAWAQKFKNLVTSLAGVPTSAYTSNPNNVSTSSSAGSSSSYSRGDHTHAISLATGDSNGQVKIAGSNVSVKGWSSKLDAPSATSTDKWKAVCLDKNLSPYLAPKTCVYGGMHATGKGFIIGGEGNTCWNRPTLKILLGSSGTSVYNLEMNLNNALNVWTNGGSDILVWWSSEEFNRGNPSQNIGKNYWSNVKPPSTSLISLTDYVSLANSGDSVRWSIDIYIAAGAVDGHTARDCLFHYDVMAYNISGSIYTFWKGYAPEVDAAFESNFVFGWPAD